jgi:predicted GNAT family acetyltransferase
MNWSYEQTRIYSTDENGRLNAETTFHQTENGETDIDHTYVHPDLRGQGIAGDMMGVVAEHLRKKGAKVTASCSYANIWFKRNKKSYADIISEDMFSEPLSCSINARHD